MQQLNSTLSNSTVNEARVTCSRWSNNLDFRYAVDITNVLSLLNKNWGWVFLVTSARDDLRSRGQAQWGLRFIF